MSKTRKFLVYVVISARIAWFLALLEHTSKIKHLSPLAGSPCFHGSSYPRTCNTESAITPHSEFDLN